MSKAIVLLIAIGLSLITVIADAFIKKASAKEVVSVGKYLALAAGLYLLTVVGWFYVLKEMKLSSAGVIYTMSTIVFIVLVSVFYFKERLSGPEILGLIMALGAIVLLYRFS